MASDGEGSSTLDFPLIHDARSQDQPQNNSNNINRLKFYHEIRWSLIFTDVQERYPTIPIPEQLWDRLCLLGSLWGQAADVMHACDQAVDREPRNLEYRDHRGLARALTGDVNGAIEDFQIVIERTDNKTQRSQYQQWIDELREGKKPFTPDELRKL